MKKYFKNISFLFIALGVFTSCDDQLEQFPYDGSPENLAYITEADFENGIRGAYYELTREGYYGSADAGSMISIGDVLSDNVIMTQVGRRTKRNLHEYTYNAGAITTAFYTNVYRTVYLSNLVLFYLEEFEGDSKANFEAEARALRAMAHFDVVRLYGKIPTQSGDANSSLGVAYVTEADVTLTPSRETVAETYNRILEDLTFALNNINQSNGPARLNRESVNLLLSRVYLYMGQWQNAVNAANNVTTQPTPRTSLVDLFTDETQAGLVLSIQNNQGAGELDVRIGNAWSQGPVTNNVPEYAVTQSLYNLYANDDIRKEAFIQTVTSAQGQHYGIKKYFGRTGQFNGVVNFKILRAEEAILNKAEAYYELGQEGSALAALDVLRNQRYENFSSPGESGTALRDAIRLERRLEFAFEYHRFFDLKRWNLPVQRDGQGEFINGSGTPSEAQTLPAGDHRWQFPFSQQMLSRNPNTVQNPGY